MLAYIARRLPRPSSSWRSSASSSSCCCISSPGDPGGDHRRRQRDRRSRSPAIRAAARPRRPAAGAVRALGRRAAAGRSRHLDLLERAGDEAGRPAHRADAVARADDADRRGDARGHASACSRPGRRARWIDRSSWCFSVLGFSVPVFVVGYLLIYVFAIKLRWLPVQGYAPIAEGFGPWLAPSDPALDRARPRLCGADRAHHPHQPCSTCWPRTTSAPRRPRASRPRPMLLQPCAEERRRADRHRDRHRRRAADRRRGHHRDGVQHPRHRPPRRRCDLASATTRSSRA